MITQSAMAFAQLLGAFSLIVTQFQSISSFAAVIARLDALVGAVETAPGRRPAGASTVVEDDGPPRVRGADAALAGRRP